MQIEGLANIIAGDKMLTIGGDGPHQHSIEGFTRDEATGDWIPSVEFGLMLAQAIDWITH